MYIWKKADGLIRVSNPNNDLSMWDILEIRLFKFLSASDTEIDFELQIKEAYREFVERLIFYLDSETDNMKRIRPLNLIHIEIGSFLWSKKGCVENRLLR